MSEIKAGLWQNTLDGSFIKVRRSGRVGVYYSDEGCDIEHVMNQKELKHCYRLVEADKPAPVVDDTFNDDTPAQTFGDIDAPMRLIGIAGQARSGKDTLAGMLLDNIEGWVQSSFAQPIKHMLGAIGVDCSDSNKGKVDERYGVFVRHMMQTLGTEWGRHTIDNDIWVKAFARAHAGKQVIVSDVRFENEADLVRKHGMIIHIVGRGGIDSGHVSENPIGFKRGDIVIDNSRDLDWLIAQVEGSAMLGRFVLGKAVSVAREDIE